MITQRHVYLLLGIAIFGVMLYGAAPAAHVQATAPVAAPATANTNTPAALNTSSVTYPIAELGGCTDKQNCAAYCNKTENMLSCVTFAEKKGMLPPAEVAVAKKAIPRIVSGNTPGGCKSKDECEKFCQGNVDQINQCISFAEEVGALPPAELAQVKRVAKALAGGAKMPGGCTNKVTCESYCQDATHIDECLNFAEAADMIPADELAQAKKVAPFVKSGQTPGGCKTKNACDAYCTVDAHFDECIGFAQKAGFVSADDAAIAKKVGGKGPGGCKRKDECAAYCNQDANAQECLNFATSKGLLSEAEQKQIQEGAQKVKTGLTQIPADVRPEVETCLKNVIGADKYDTYLNGTVTVTKAVGDKIGPCFENAMKDYAQKMMQQGAAGAGGVPGAGGAGGAPSGMPGSAPTNIPKEFQGQIPAGVPESMKADIQKKIQEQMKAGGKAGAPANIQGGALPAEMPDSVKAEIQKKIQEMMKADAAQKGGQAGPPANIPTGPAAGQQMGPPANIKMGPPAGTQMGPPAGAQMGPPAGIQGGPPAGGAPNGPPQ